MYPTLYDLVQSTIGVSIKPLTIVNTFGLMVAISFMAAFYIMSLELKRLEKEGKIFSSVSTKLFKAVQNPIDYVLNFAMGFVFGWKIFFMLTNFDLVRENSQAVIFSTQGNIIAGLVVGALFVFQKYREYTNFKKRYPEPVEKEVTEHPFQAMGMLTMSAFVAGILGAKLFHIFENWEASIADPIDAIFSLSGLTYYGGLICGGAAVVYFANKKGIKPLHMLDAGGSAMMLAYGLGRAGCHLAGDGDWGIDNLKPAPSWIPDFLWSSKYPHNVLNADYGNAIEGCVGPYCNELINPVYPTPLYEIIMCVILFGVLWSIRKKIKVPGVLFGIYLILNGLERFLIEKIRVNNIIHKFGLEFTQAEMISSIIVILGIVLIIYSKKIYAKSSANTTSHT